MKRSFLLALLSATLLTSPALANNVTGEASLTGSKTTGNTDTTDIGLGLKLALDQDVWRHKFSASVDFGEAAGVQTRERYLAAYQIERDVSDRLFVYGNGDVFFDDFGAFTEGYFVGGGLGYKAILPDPIGWNLTAGLGFRSQEDALGIAEEELAFRAGSDFDWALNENVSLYNDSELVTASSNTYIWNEIGLTANLMGNLAARASFRVDYNSDAPVGSVSTDTITRFGIVYTIE